MAQDRKKALHKSVAANYVLIRTVYPLPLGLLLFEKEYTFR